MSPAGMSFRRSSLRSLPSSRKISLRLLARHLDALERRVLGDDLAHLRLDRLEVVGGEGALEAEVVLELLRVVLAAGVVERLRPEPGHRVGEHVLGRVADELARLGALVGEEPERPAVGERLAQVDLPPGELGADRVLGEPRTDRTARLRAASCRAARVRSEPSGRVEKSDGELMESSWLRQAGWEKAAAARRLKSRPDGEARTAAQPGRRSRTRTGDLYRVKVAL